MASSSCNLMTSDLGKTKITVFMYESCYTTRVSQRPRNRKPRLKDSQITTKEKQKLLQDVVEHMNVLQISKDINSLESGTSTYNDSKDTDLKMSWFQP